MQHVKYAVGIDVSKDKLGSCISLINTTQKVTVKGSTSFNNTSEGYKLLSKWVEKHHKEDLPVVFVLEARVCIMSNWPGISISKATR